MLLWETLGSSLEVPRVPANVNVPFHRLWCTTTNERELRVGRGGVGWVVGGEWVGVWRGVAQIAP